MDSDPAVDSAAVVDSARVVASEVDDGSSVAVVSDATSVLPNVVVVVVVAG